MPLTGLAVRTDRSYYTRYEPARAVVHATVTPTPSTGIDGEQVRVDLIRTRASGDAVLATTTVTFTGAGAQAPKVVSFDLRTLKQDGYSLVRRSARPQDYRVEVTSVAAPSVVAAAPFTVVPISVERMRSEYLLGLTLQTVERRMPRAQPVNVTGVVVTDVGLSSVLGPGVLAWVFSTTSLTWRGGAAVAVTGPGSYVLNDTAGQYLLVEVANATALPGSDKTDTLIIDYGRMTDEAIMDQVLAAFDEWERLLDVPLEPLWVSTKQLEADGPYDVLKDGVTLYRPDNRWEWVEIKTPFHQLKKVYALYGYMNRSRTMEVSQEWIKVTERTGFIQLVPSAGAMISTWLFMGGITWPAFISLDSVPDFWQMRVVHGYEDFPPALIRHIAMTAAIPLLIQAGQARFPTGATSYSLSRDGVSESRSVQPGVFQAQVQQYQQLTGLGRDGSYDRKVASLRQQYRGVAFVTL